MPDASGRFNMDGMRGTLPGHHSPRRRPNGPPAMRVSCSITHLGFGHLDGQNDKYSLEHPMPLGETSDVTFDHHKRRLALALVGVAESTVRLWIDYGQIEHAFFLKNFDRNVLLVLKYAARIDRAGQRQSQINVEHGAIAQVLNRQLLVQFASSNERAKLEAALKPQLGAQKLTHIKLIVDTERPTCSLYNMRKVEAFMSEVSGPVGFKIDDLIRDGSITSQQLLNLKTDILELERKRGPKVAELVLIEFANNLRRPKRLGQPKAQQSKAGPSVSMANQLRQASLMVSDTIGGKLVSDLCQTRFATVTATGIDLAGPQIEQSNSTLRLYEEYSEHFLRVSFRDENHDQFYMTDDWNVPAFIEWRFRSFLLNGIIVGGRKYDFYACSSNGLRDQQAVFVNPFRLRNGHRINASVMREALGSFKKCDRNPAKLLSRLGQTLSTTRLGATLAGDEIKWKKDVNSTGDEYCFTDGCGTISLDLAREINDKLDALMTPIERHSAVASTCFQIRLGGSKGMLSIDSRLEGRKVCLRESMHKFEGVLRTLDIAKRFTSPSRAFTNKSLIQILEALGVPAATFLRLQKQAIDKTVSAKSDWASFVDLMATFNLGFASQLGPTLTWLIKDVGLGPANVLRDSFNRALVDLATLHSLRELKFRARIPLPTSSHFNLVGIADEDDFLDEGGVYVCIHERGKAPVCLDGIVAVSRSPSNHPGDVQRARAVGKVDPSRAPHLAAQENCIVFSVRGSRPLPSMLSGGDLDGDLFLVSACDLVPPRSVEAGQHTALKGVDLVKAANRFDMVEFFINHTISNCLGQLANLHLHFADYSPQGVFAPICLDLAAKFSQAVDSAKTGREIDFKTLPPAPPTRPDFMEKEVNYAKYRGKHGSNTYPSLKANGLLFRAIGPQLLKPADLLDFGSAHQSNEGYFSLVDLLVKSAFGRAQPVQPALVDEVAKLIQPFTDSLHSIATVLSPQRPLTEQEILLGVIAACAKSNKAKGELTEQLSERVGHVFADLRSQIAGGDAVKERMRVARSWAAIKAVEQYGMEWGVRSFVWIALSELREAVEAAKLAAN